MLSELQKARLKFKPKTPAILKSPIVSIKAKTGAATQSIADQAKVKQLFAHTYGLPAVTFTKGKNSKVNKKPVKIGVVLSGGQAPGGHNVIAGIYDALKKANPKNKLIGFLKGPGGIVENKFKELDVKIIDAYRNTGGFDMIQSGRTKIESKEQFEKVKENLIKNGIDTLIVVGGDDSNTNAGMLAEYFMKQKAGVKVIGVPKTIDGDLKNEWVETSFGFDTATKIYSELIGNLLRDVNSAQKYWHFIRLMGRSASHITLECAFKTHPNVTLIGEEVYAEKQTLGHVVDYIAEVVMKRSQAGKNFGIVLVPEGLIEFIPEMKELIKKLNDLLAQYESEINNMETLKQKKMFIESKLPENLASLLKSLPEDIAHQLLLDRDPHGNVMVSQIETEKLLIEMVSKKLKELKKANAYTGKFSTVTHFFGYEGRCGFPSAFDSNYCYALGFTAVLLALNGFTAYMSSVRNLVKAPEQWLCGGIPLTMLMNIERRKGEDKPVIMKALVDLNGKPFRAFEIEREKWAISEDYIFPGPIQYFGPSEIVDAPTETLKYEKSKK